MSVDRTKVLEAVQKHLSKGNYDRAIAELRKLVAADPSDIRTWLKIGDLHYRKGSHGEAIETYSRVANQYGEQGFFLKAVAVYKQILKLDPSRLEIQVKLGEMYEMLQLVTDALSTYESVAVAFARAGKIDQALDALGRMAGLDPENLRVRIKYAEALSKAGRTKEAADEFEAGAGLLKAQGRLDDYIKVAERLLYHRPEDVSVAGELARQYLDRDDPRRALAKLQLSFKADPKNIETLEMLAEAFRQLEQVPKAISVYREVARLHQDSKNQAEHSKILRRILELDPDDADARDGLAKYKSTRQVAKDIQPPAHAVVEPARPPEDDDDGLGLMDDPDEDLQVMEVDDDDLLLEEDLEQVELEELEGASEPAPPPEIQPSQEQNQAQIARLLTECDVFQRYGLTAKVIEQLHGVLEIDPNHIEARERLKELHLAAGNTENAVEQLLALAQILAHEESPAATIYARQALELAPDDPDALEMLEALGVSRTSQVPPEPAPPPEADATDSEDPDDDLFFMDETASGEDRAAQETDGEASAADSDQAAIDGDRGSIEEPIDPASLLTLVDEDGESDDVQDGPTGLSPAVQFDSEPPPLAAETDPAGKATALDDEALMDLLAPMTPEEFEEVPLAVDSEERAAVEANERLSSPPGEVEEVLDEVDFFIAQGLLSEAHSSLSEALGSHPNHPILNEKLQEVETLRQNEGTAHSATQPLEGDQSFEFAERLAADFDEVEDTLAGSNVLDVDLVFEQFKKGVETQVSSEDTETHFDLGIAYKEMGLLDDAIGEFALCLANPQRVCIAETMIGLCYVEKQDFNGAVNHFKKGLYAELKNEREELGLYYELGNAYTLMNDSREALYYFQKVQKRDPSFRSVEDRIRQLSAPSASEAPPLTLAQDDIDRAFDDLLGED